MYGEVLMLDSGVKSCLMLHVLIAGSSESVLNLQNTFNIFVMSFARHAVGLSYNEMYTQILTSEK